MSWGIVVEWDVRGLPCSMWMQRTDEPTIDDAKEFDSEADAAQFILQVTPCPYDRVLAPQEFEPDMNGAVANMEAHLHHLITEDEGTI